MKKTMAEKPRQFAYITVGQIIEELRNHEEIPITRPTFYRMEDDGKIPTFGRIKIKLTEEVVDGKKRRRHWRKYNKQEAEQVKQRIREEYRRVPTSPAL